MKKIILWIILWLLFFSSVNADVIIVTNNKLDSFIDVWKTLNVLLFLIEYLFLFISIILFINWYKKLSFFWLSLFLLYFLGYFPLWMWEPSLFDIAIFFYIIIWIPLFLLITIIESNKNKLWKHY